MILLIKTKPDILLWKGKISWVPTSTQRTIKTCQRGRNSCLEKCAPYLGIEFQLVMSEIANVQRHYTESVSYIYMSMHM